jgi:hypothetical protein
MPQSQGKKRCWLCDNAIWFIPLWTWMIVLATGLFMLGLLRPDAITGWISLMGVMMLLLAVCIGVMIDENGRDQARDALKVSAVLPPLPAVRPAAKRG